MNTKELQSIFLSDKAKKLLHHPQGMGNYFTFKSAVDILGLNWDELLPNGVYNVTGEGYYDMGYMANHIGPPESALKAMKEHCTLEELRVYPPDCMPELKALVAEQKFGRKLGDDFTVLGMEGAQGGIGYTYMTFLNPGDEVITTDPAYFHFVPGAEINGATIKAIKLGPHNGFKLDPKEIEAAITPKTKMIVVCDPINPFGVVATKDELLSIAEIARRNNVLIFNNVTHNTHQTDPNANHITMASLHTPKTPMDHVISVSGTSKGYGLPALRVGFMAGHPALIRGAFLLKMETTKIHINYPGQYAALAAMKDHDYVEKSTEIIRRNYKHIEETVHATEGVTIPVKPQYGFCMIIDVSGTGVSAQEISCALLKYKIATITGDGLGNVGATEYLRLNYSHPDIKCVETFREALPKAVADAKTGMYRQAVIDFFEKTGTERGKQIIEILKRQV
ncbi:MAG: pyridoxal phosphate-dependent aminotransferase [Eubacteriales bacterium]|nr:pyridoxal phosphate-dependent aminotransferase [Eubacteriales bacterium]